MNNDGLTLNQLAERNAVLVSEVEKLRTERDQLAAESVGLKAAFDKPQAYLSWHAIPPTWNEPLPCGEYLDVHDTDGHKNSDGTDCWPFFSKPEIETPATDLIVAGIKADGVEMFVEKCREKSKQAISSDIRDNWWLAGEHADDFAKQLREGAK
ncbi:hypothetical protein RZP54_23645 [Raoultella ornithinolytica]|uniref:hypothetical protein n=1 Tax=Raoultella ornithinolytica TaxID=54291 RepID=UPI00292C5ECB|nr:hypothetical protein [Raoultella ornithinolytica]MDV0591948.1 hypothetical protein [Raoultella ornithinolytica]